MSITQTTIVPSMNLTQLAELAGVSKSTVSRALRDHPRISVAIKEKIRQLAQQHHYEPQPLLSQVLSEVRRGAQQKTAPIIAYLDGGKYADDLLKYPTIRKFYQGAKSHTQAQGYQLDYFWIGDPQLTPARLLKILRTRKITTALVRFATKDIERMERWLDELRKDLYLITVGFQYPGQGVSFAMNDQSQTARLALKQMLNKGYQRIGAVMNRGTEEMINFRFYGSYHAVRAQNQDRMLSEPLLIEQHKDDHDGELIYRWYSERQPDTILFSNSFLCQCFIEKCPPDLQKRVSYAILDQHEEDKNLAGVNQRNDVVGSAAAQLAIDALIERRHYGHLGEHGINIEGVWHEGPSLPCKKQKASSPQRRRSVQA
jgi:LacI family transcriptional regulator